MLDHPLDRPGLCALRQIEPELAAGGRKVLALSYGWQSPPHPDPQGTTLEAVRGYLQRLEDKGVKLDELLNMLKQEEQLNDVMKGARHTAGHDADLHRAAYTALHRLYRKCG